MLLVGLGLAERGIEIVVSLNKASLFELPSIVADEYFSNQSNVFKVRFLYRSVGANQEKALIFKLDQATPTDLLYFSPQSRDQFELTDVELYDFDGGFFRVPLEEIPNLEIDLSNSTMTLADVSSFGDILQGNNPQ